MSSINKKDHVLISKSIKNLSLRLYDFAVTATMLFHIIQNVSISIISTLISAFTTSVRVKRVRILFSTAKLLMKAVSYVTVKPVKSVFSVKEFGKIYFDGAIRLIGTYASKLTQKTYSNFKNKVSISIALILGTFYTLGTFDTDTLGVLDVNTLGEMDYTEL